MGHLCDFRTFPQFVFFGMYHHSLSSFVFFFNIVRKMPKRQLVCIGRKQQSQLSFYIKFHSLCSLNYIKQYYRTYRGK